MGRHLHLFLIYPLTYASWSMRICPRLQISIFRPIIGGCIPYAGRNVILLFSSSGTLPLTFVDLTLIVVNFSPRSDLGWVAYGPSMDDADWSRVCMTLGYRSRDTFACQCFELFQQHTPPQQLLDEHTHAGFRRTHSRLLVETKVHYVTCLHDMTLGQVFAQHVTRVSSMSLSPSAELSTAEQAPAFESKYCSQPCEHALQTNH